MITGKYEELTDYTKRFKCPEHPDMELTVASHPTKGLVIKCGAGHWPEEITPVRSLTEQHKQGKELPEPIKSAVVKGIAKRQAAAVQRGEPVTLGGIPAADLVTGELIPLPMLEALVTWARAAGLVPGLGHVCFMHGKPYVEVSGYLYLAYKSGKSVQLRSRPLTDEERKTYQIPDGAHAWTCEASVSHGESSFTGLGIVTLEEMIAKSSRDPSRLRSPVVAAHPWLQAQKRAEWQALKRAFPLDIPGGDKEEDKQP